MTFSNVKNRLTNYSAERKTHNSFFGETRLLERYCILTKMTWYDYVYYLYLSKRNGTCTLLFKKKCTVQYSIINYCAADDNIAITYTKPTCNRPKEPFAASSMGCKLFTKDQMVPQHHNQSAYKICYSGVLPVQVVFFFFFFLHKYKQILVDYRFNPTNTSRLLIMDCNIYHITGARGLVVSWTLTLTSDYSEIAVDCSLTIFSTNIAAAHRLDLLGRDHCLAVGLTDFSQYQAGWQFAEFCHENRKKCRPRAARV